MLLGRTSFLVHLSSFCYFWVCEGGRSRHKEEDKCSLQLKLDGSDCDSSAQSMHDLENRFLGVIGFAARSLFTQKSDEGIIE